MTPRGRMANATGLRSSARRSAPPAGQTCIHNVTGILKPATAVSERADCGGTGGLPIGRPASAAGASCAPDDVQVRRDVWVGIRIDGYGRLGARLRMVIIRMNCPWLSGDRAARRGTLRACVR